MCTFSNAVRFWTAVAVTAVLGTVVLGSINEIKTGHFWATANAQSARSGVASEQCQPTMYADLNPDSVYVDVTKPLPKTITVGGHGGTVVVLLVRPLQLVGPVGNLTAQAAATDGHAAPLFTLVNNHYVSVPLCRFIVVQWRVVRAGSGKITVTDMPVSPDAQPHSETITVIAN